MLIRSTWTLTPEVATALPRSYGLELVKELHQRLGLSLGGETIPSVTYSGLMGKVAPSQDFFHFQPGEPYQLVLCGLQEPAAKAIAQLDLADALEFLGAKLLIQDRQTETTSYEALYHDLIASEPEPQTGFDLQFVTPTAFAQDRTYLPLPVPTLMFRSWLERWNHFAPVYLGSQELLAYLGNAIGLNRHRLRTYPFRVYKGQIAGFQGEVRLNLLGHADPLLANVASLLVAYSQFSGTGIKTRLGMGQTIGGARESR